MAGLLNWPAALTPGMVEFFVDARNRGGGPSLSGREQVVDSLASVWRATLGDIAVNSRAQLFAARALVAALSGRRNPILVPTFERGRAPFPVDRYGRTLNARTLRTPSLDGTAYADPISLLDDQVRAEVAVGGAQFGQEISIRMLAGSAPQAGHYFGVGQFLHLITRVVSTAGAVTAVECAPAFRAAIPAGAIVNFTSPVCRMRLASDDQGRLPLRLNRHGMLALEFIED